ncbi:hypothetical protein Bca4012_068532 [Brassica carinata]
MGLRKRYSVVQNAIQYAVDGTCKELTARSVVIATSNCGSRLFPEFDYSLLFDSTSGVRLLLDQTVHLVEALLQIVMIHLSHLLILLEPKRVPTTVLLTSHCTTGLLSLANLQASAMYNLSLQGQPLVFPTFREYASWCAQDTKRVLQSGDGNEKYQSPNSIRRNSAQKKIQICHRDLKLENTLLDGSPAPLLKAC